MPKKMNFWPSVFSGINAMVGAGIVSMPGILMVESGAGSLYILGLGLFLSLCLSLTLVRLQILYPKSSWYYDFAKLWGGNLAGEICRFLYVLGLGFAMSFLTQQSGLWLHNFFPQIDSTILSVLALVFLSALILFGVKTSSWIQIFIGMSVFIPLFFTALFCWSHVENFFVPPLLDMEHFWKSFPKVIFGYLGFESILSLVPVLKEPEKNSTKLMLTSITILGLFYFFFIGSFIYCLQEDLIQQGSQLTLSQILLKRFPDFYFSSQLLTLGGIFALLGTIFSMNMSISTLLSYSFFQAQIHEKKGRIVTLLFSSFVLVLTLTFDPGKLINLATFLIVLSFLLATIFIFRLKHLWKNGFNFVSCLGFGTACLMIYYSFWDLWNQFF